MALRLATTTLNLADGPIEVAVGEATPEQQLQCCKLAGTAFAAPLSQDQYVELEDYLGSLSLAVDGSRRYWCLFPTNNPNCILATCKTLHRFILVKDGQAALSEGDGYCLASVITNPDYRKSGLASVLMEHVAEWMDGPGAGTGSMLYTSIGDNLCARDVESVKEEMRETNISEDQTLAAVAPTADLVNLLQERANFMASKLFGKVTEHRGAISEAGNSWIYCPSNEPRARIQAGGAMRTTSGEVQARSRIEAAPLAIQPFGAITVEVDGHGNKLEYFLKIIRRPRHLELAKGEFESQAELQKYLPEDTVVPLAYGPLELDSSASFFLSTFRNLSDKTLEPTQLAAVLEKLHQTSASPTGKFGFHITTFNGIVPLVNEWCDTWEEFFSRQLRSDIEWEQSIRGPDPEIDEIGAQFFGKVIPRLLRPLQTGGRNIKPVLVHGDLWPGNVQIDRDTQRVILFDSCCCYAHNELDLSMMRESRYHFTGEHASKYLESMRPSQPEEDFDDRNAIYAM
ncbi:hypothetical protein SLS63_003727 [Diaporthe eres]|uniref:protein-ribulosamine 3-kinase n=1 Tax=Diaporthe eres TaxID=83184 RepID=A0ABR1PG90_DIAER